MQSNVVNRRRDFMGTVTKEAIRRRWLKVGIILGVVLLSLVLGLTLSVPLKIAVIVLPFAILGMFMILRWPPLGLVLLIIGSQIRFTDIPKIDMPAALLLALAFLWLLRMVAYEKEILLVSAPSVTAVLGFGICVILSFIVGQLPWFPVAGAPMETQLGGALIFIATFLAFILVTQQVKDIIWLKWMAFSFLFFGVIFSVLAVIPGGWAINHQFLSRSTFGNSMFRVLVLSVGLSQALINRSLKMRWRALFGFAALAILYIGIVQVRSWTSGWVPPVVAFVAVIWFGLPRYAMPLSLLALTYIGMQWELVYGMVAGDNEYSTISRLDAWRVMGEIIKVNPVFGLGPTNYYFYTPLYNILGFYVEFNSHNNYVDLLAQTGFVGMACYIWVLWSIAKLGLRLLKELPHGGFAHAYVVGCMGTLVAAVVAGMLGDWVIPFYYNIGIQGLRASGVAFMLWGGMVAIDYLNKTGRPLD